MDLDTLIVTIFCQIDDLLAEMFAKRRLRERGREPILADAEVLSIEIIGEYLGLSQDKQIFEYLRRHFRDFFSATEADSSNNFRATSGEFVACQRKCLAETTGRG